MTRNWLGELLGDKNLDSAGNALIAAYGWTKEWQVLLLGLLVVVSALILARALRKAAVVPAPQTAGLNEHRADLRAEPGPAARPNASGDLVGELEQLRSLIRSALSAFTLTAEKENSPVQFLCQRVARMRLDRFPLSASASKAQQDQYAALQEQLESLRQQLKRQANAAEISATLVQLNTSARNLVAALPPPAASRRQAASE